jgi:pantoate--beta-alanine ligase
MKIILNKNNLIKFIKNEKRIGFIPTMGAIHAGHMSLFKKSKNQCNKTVVSIFINKPQFNKKSDYEKYPRNLKKDIRLIKKANVDFLYIPKNKEIYYNGTNKKIKINSFSKDLCGKSRPLHFKSVADVVERFINIIKPNNIYFGNKDMQQLIIMKDFIKKNYPKTKVIGCKTVRKKNGLVLSSRNLLLSNEEKIIASKIYKLILVNKKKLINNKNHINKIKIKIFKLGVKNIDYFKIININKIIKPYRNKEQYKIFIAYFLRSTRLIDNI